MAFVALPSGRGPSHAGYTQIADKLDGLCEQERIAKGEITRLVKDTEKNWGSFTPTQRSHIEQKVVRLERAVQANNERLEERAQSIHLLARKPRKYGTFGHK